jgi:CBS domain-containing protein
MEMPPSSEDREAYHDELTHDAGEALEHELGTVPRRPALIVEPADTVAEVIRRMNDQAVGCALVVDDGALVGIFTERDVLKKIATSTLDTRKVPVREVMTPEPDALPADASVAFALNRMSVEGYRHVPLLDQNGSPIGVVAMRDIICWLVDQHPDRVHNVPPAPASYPQKREGA